MKNNSNKDNGKSNISAAQLKKFIGAKIKLYRKKKNLSQAQLAELVNIEVKSLSRIESGHNYPQCDNLVAISKALDISPWQLYFSSEAKNVQAMKKDIISALEEDEAKILPIYQYLQSID